MSETEQFIPLDDINIDEQGSTSSEQQKHEKVRGSITSSLDQLRHVRVTIDSRSFAPHLISME